MRRGDYRQYPGTRVTWVRRVDSKARAGKKLPGNLGDAVTPPLPANPRGNPQISSPLAEKDQGKDPPDERETPNDSFDEVKAITRDLEGPVERGTDLPYQIEHHLGDDDCTHPRGQISTKIQDRVSSKTQYNKVLGMCTFQKSFFVVQ